MMRQWVYNGFGTRYKPVMSALMGLQRVHEDAYICIYVVEVVEDNYFCRNNYFRQTSRLFSKYRVDISKIISDIWSSVYIEDPRDI